ncbi:uncharacterized protein [Physcomitrium patens]|uniref:uncharacterized protein isoform X2 n=1 Tax=Physcomitrium patens TaxID=3218 RepID=UPI003CCCF2D7
MRWEWTCQGEEGRRRPRLWLRPQAPSYCSHVVTLDGLHPPSPPPQIVCAGRRAGPSSSISRSCISLCIALCLTRFGILSRFFVEVLGHHFRRVIAHSLAPASICGSWTLGEFARGQHVSAHVMVTCSCRQLEEGWLLI